VQGVGFRAACAREAKRLGLGGSVRNRPDGSVEILAEGDEATVAALSEWCRTGPLYSEVKNVISLNEEPMDEHHFRIVN